LVKLGVGIEEAIREVKARAKGLKVFGERYMAQTPKVRPRSFFMLCYIVGYELTNTYLVDSDPDGHTLNT
jgi:hypothetical protein